MSISKEISKKIKQYRRGKPFLSADFLALGSRAAIDQALWRLVKSGEIRRIKNGMFVKSEKNAYAGEVLPGVEEVARFLAQRSGDKVAISGADAARRFGFTTQMPSQPVFFTDGPSRKYHLGNQEVRLKHVAARKVALAGSPAGEALSALWYLGSNEVTPRTFERIESQLPGKEFSTLMKNQAVMPGWMRSVLGEYQRGLQVD